SLQGLRWLPAYLALAVAVVVVLAFLRVEFQGACKAGLISGLERLVDGRIRQLCVKAGGLARQLLRRVRIRVGDHGETVQGGEPGIHRRIGRQASLEREDVGEQVVKARL